MTSHTFTSRGPVILALGLWAFQGMASAQLPKSTQNPDLKRELDIFGSVIKDRLTEKGIVKGLPSAGGGATHLPGPGTPGFIGVSPFDWNTRCQYVPTVGVIYTIPVSFLLVNPEEKTKKPEPAETKEEKQDLWEKHEREAKTGPQAAAAPQAGTMQPFDLPGLKAEALKENFEQLHQGFGMMGFGVPAGPAYDPEKVKSLRSALIEVLAQYGYRVKNLPEGEQILFIVTSPRAPFGASGSVFIRSSEGGEAREFFLPPGGAEGSSRDQYLLAIKKGELTAELAPEQIEGKLTERVF